jgi:hypothetical protein
MRDPRDAGDSTFISSPGLGDVGPFRSSAARRRDAAAEAALEALESGQVYARAQAALEHGDGLSAQLREGFERLQTALAANATARDGLLQAVVSLVRYVRELDDPPERALILVKTLIHESLPMTVSPKEREALEAAAVRWAIDAYYDAAS